MDWGSVFCPSPPDLHFWKRANYLMRYGCKIVCNFGILGILLLSHVQLQTLPIHMPLKKVPWTVINICSVKRELFARILYSKSCIQYCAKAMQMNFDDFRSLFSRIFERNCTWNFAKFRAKRFYCQTIFWATFRGKIAQYYGRTNEKSQVRKFTEA